MSKLGGIAKGVMTGAAIAVTAVTTAIVGTTTALVSGAKETAAYGDNIDKMSQKIGMSAESYQKWDFVLQQNGASIDGLQTSMKTLSSAADSGSEAFDRLGISQEEVASSSPEELFEKTITALQGMEEGTERTRSEERRVGKEC